MAELGWPAALLVAGTDAHRRRQFVRELQQKFIAAGGTVHSLTGDDGAEIGRLLSSVGVLFPAMMLVVVTEPEKLKLDLLGAHLGRPANGFTFLLVSEADRPGGEVVGAIPKEATRTFALPPSYKLDEHAADYAIQRARAGGVHLAGPLASALVRRVGSDLGVVHYEVDKLLRYLRARGDRELTAEHVRATVAPLVELDGVTLVEALAGRDRRRLADELHRYYLSKRGDPTVELCGRVLTPTVLRWFQAAHLRSTGLSATVAAGRVGANPWYWENKILPAAAAWGPAGCRQLLKVIGDSQEAVFAGAISPWKLLVAGLLRATPTASVTAQ